MPGLAKTGWRLPGLRVPGWRVLAVFWLGLLLIGGAAAAALQAIGPRPASHATPASVSSVSAASAATAEPLVGVPAANRSSTSVPAAPIAPVPALNTSDVRPPVHAGPIAAPDAALLEPSPVGGDAQRPRIAANGRTSMSVYSRFADPSDKRPKVAVLIVGFGMSTAESIVAMTALPGAVTLGFSPYSAHPEALLKEARAEGHEFLVTVPMESQGYPLNQSGVHALLTGSDPTANDANLQWTLSRMQGEVGLTGASDGLRGERFGSATVPFGVMLNEFAARGLLYVDPRVGAHPTPPPHTTVINVTLVLDDPPAKADIDAKLATLEQQARDNGWALGLGGPLRPVLVDRVAAWARGLEARGIALVPVSALVAPHPP